MEEKIIDQAIAIWGPFGMVVVILVVALLIVGRQYLARQKAYEERDDKRLAMYMQSTAEFTRTAADNNIVLQELKEVVGDVHTLMIKINERL